MKNQRLFYLSVLQLFPFTLALNLTVNSASKSCKQFLALDHVVAKGLQEGKDIEGDESLINLSVILTNMAPDEAKAPESMFSYLDKYLSSLLAHLTQESRLRLLIISDASLVHLLRLHLKM